MKYKPNKITSQKWMRMMTATTIWHVFASIFFVQIWIVGLKIHGGRLLGLNLSHRWIMGLNKKKVASKVYTIYYFCYIRNSNSGTPTHTPISKISFFFWIIISKTYSSLKIPFLVPLISRTLCKDVKSRSSYEVGACLDVKFDLMRDQI